MPTHQFEKEEDIDLKLINLLITHCRNSKQIIILKMSGIRDYP
jgi:hypothetical protein